MRTALFFIGFLAAVASVSAQSWLQFPLSVTLRDVSERGKPLRTVYPASLPLPAYPVDVLRAGIYSGSVTVRATVNEDCSISAIQVIHCTIPEFGESAKDAVSRWRFIRPPGSMAGKWPSTVVECRFDFQLHEQ